VLLAAIEMVACMRHYNKFKAAPHNSVIAMDRMKKQNLEKDFGD
jgi:hypothetical protein